MNGGLKTSRSRYFLYSTNTFQTISKHLIGTEHKIIFTPHTITTRKTQTLSFNMDSTKIKAPKGQEDLKDALGNFVYAQPEYSDKLKLAEGLSKKEQRASRVKETSQEERTEAEGAEAHYVGLIEGTSTEMYHLSFLLFECKGGSDA
jgi:hypothetical protein